MLKSRSVQRRRYALKVPAAHFYVEIVDRVPLPRSGRKNRASEQREDFFGHRKAVGADAPAATFGAHLCAVRSCFFRLLREKQYSYPAQLSVKGVCKGESLVPLCPVLLPFAGAKGRPPRRAVLTMPCKRPRPAGRRNENMPRQKDRKKLLPQRDRSFICGGKWGASDGSLYFAGTQAAGAGVDTAGSTVYNCLYSSDIGLPGTVRTAMGVRNLDTESDALTTNFAFCHLSAPPYRAI